MKNLTIQEKFYYENIKIIFLDGGTNGVGKTTIIKRMLNEESIFPEFQEDCSKTIILKQEIKLLLILSIQSILYHQR